MSPWDDPCEFFWRVPPMFLALLSRTDSSGGSPVLGSAGRGLICGASERAAALWGGSAATSAEGPFTRAPKARKIAEAEIQQD